MATKMAIKATGYFLLWIVPIAFVIGFAFRITGLFDCSFPVYRLLIAVIILTLAIALSIFGGWILSHPSSQLKSRKPVGVAILILAICGTIYTAYELIAWWNYWALIFLIPQMTIFIVMLTGGLFLIKPAPPK